jgi:hypothetical protein
LKNVSNEIPSLYEMGKEFNTAEGGSKETYVLLLIENEGR